MGGYEWVLLVLVVCLRVLVQNCNLSIVGPKWIFIKKDIKHPSTYLKMSTNVINQIFIIPQIYFG